MFNFDIYVNDQSQIMIDQAVSEKKMFEIVDGRRTDAGAWVYFKLTL